MPEPDDVPFPDVPPTVRDLIEQVETGKIGFVMHDADGRPVFDAGPYVRALVAANGGSANWTEADVDRATLYLRSGRAEAERIGSEIYDAHGFDGMVRVHDFMCRILPRGGPRELEMAWDGIGEWLG
jgi:hypothetical protein